MSRRVTADSSSLLPGLLSSTAGWSDRFVFAVAAGFLGFYRQYSSTKPLQSGLFFIIIGKNLPEVKCLAKLSDPITMLKGIGPAKAKQFANLNIFTLRDLICHFPRGYEDRTKLVPIEKLEPDVPACFKAMVMTAPRTAHIRKGLDITRVQVADHSGRLNVTFFNNRYVSEQLQYPFPDFPFPADKARILQHSPLPVPREILPAPPPPII